MPMPRDEHENLLNELLTPDLEVSRKTEILQSLRDDYTTVHADFTQTGEAMEKLKKENSDLVVSNSMLFRQSSQTQVKKEEDVKQEFSETVSIEELEKI